MPHLSEEVYSCMDVIELMGRFEPLLLGIAAVVLSTAFVAMLVQWFRCCRFLRSYRQDLIKSVKALRIHKMLGRLGISNRRYFCKMLSTEVENQLIRCQQCANTAECDAVLEGGKSIDESTFCPNFAELSRLSRRRPGIQELPRSHAPQVPTQAFRQGSLMGRPTAEG
jgi:hypothetical protein